MTLVTLCDVGVAYDGYDALRHVNLQIDDRDFLGIIGPNGGGKTSLVKAILGTVPYSGSIKLAPELFRGRERLIGYMPQITNFDRAFPISVFEVVLSGLQGHHGFRTPYNRKDRNRALKLIENAVGFRVFINDVLTDVSLPQDRYSSMAAPPRGANTWLPQLDSNQRHRG